MAKNRWIFKKGLRTLYFVRELTRVKEKYKEIIKIFSNDVTRSNVFELQTSFVNSLRLNDYFFIKTYSYRRLLDIKNLDAKNNQHVCKYVLVESEFKSFFYNEFPLFINIDFSIKEKENIITFYFHDFEFYYRKVKNRKEIFDVFLNLKRQIEFEYKINI